MPIEETDPDGRRLGLPDRSAVTDRLLTSLTLKGPSPHEERCVLPTSNLTLMYQLYQWFDILLMMTTRRELIKCYRIQCLASAQFVFMV